MKINKILKRIEIGAIGLLFATSSFGQTLPEGLNPTQFRSAINDKFDNLSDSTETAHEQISIAEGDISNLEGGSGMVYPVAGLVRSDGSGWSASIVDNSGNWNTAYGWGNHAAASYSTQSALEDTASNIRTAIEGLEVVTVSGSYDYITLSGQDIVRGQIDLTTDVSGELDTSNVDMGQLDNKFLIASDTVQLLAGDGITFTEGVNTETISWDSTAVYDYIDTEISGVGGGSSEYDSTYIHYRVDSLVTAFNNLQLNFENLLAAVEDLGVDVVAPQFVSAELGTYNDSIILVLYDTTDIHQDSIPPTSAYLFTESGTTFGIEAVTINEDSVFIALDSTGLYGETYLLSYTGEYPFLQDSTGNKASNFSGTTVTNNIAETTSPGDFTFLMEPTGDGSGVYAMTVNTDATITLTLDGAARFYSDDEGTLDESTTWSPISGADRGIYFKCPSGSSELTFSDIDQINKFKYGYYVNTWVSDTDAPSLNVSIEEFSSTNLTYWQASTNVIDTSDFSDYTNLTYYTGVGKGSIDDLTPLEYISTSGSTTVVTGDVSNIPNAYYISIWSQHPWYENQITYTSYTWPSTMHKFDIQNNSSYGWSVSDITAAILDADDVTTWGGFNQTVYINLHHASMVDETQGGIWGDFSGTADPSALATAAKSLHVTKDVSISLNGITWPDLGDTDDGTGLPTGFGDWWRE